MKKLFLTFGVIALVIILIAAILALLSVFNLISFFPELTPNDKVSYPEDQVTILFAYVDSLEERSFFVQDIWLVYVVTSRMDTAIFQEIQQAHLSTTRFERSVNENKFMRIIEAEENLDVDYVFLIDEIGRNLINDLLESQQSSINLENSNGFCEILTADEFQMFDLYLRYGNEHVRTTIPSSLIKQLSANENLTDSLYCESIEP